MGLINMTFTAFEELIEDAAAETHAFAYLSASTDTTTTTAEVWYPVSGTFVNVFSSFEFDTDHITYLGANTHRFEIDWHAKVATDTSTTKFNITVRINGTAIETAKMGTLLKQADTPAAVSGTVVADLAQSDEIQIVVQSDKAGAVITFGEFVTSMTRQTLARQ